MSAEKNNQFWAVKAAKDTIERFPEERLYTCASGISPSGKMHFGNFRDLITTFAVAYEIKKLGRESRVIFSLDDYDRFRKVPKGVPAEFREHIGKPLSEIPAPDGSDATYATYFSEELIQATEHMGMQIDYIYQSEKYKNGDYIEGIKMAMQKREKIANILISFMSEKGKVARDLNEEEYIKEYYPIRVYSRFTGKDNTIVLNYDGESTITYQCVDTEKEETVDLAKDAIAKLSWKIDWPMRWKHEGVRFEPGGSDHGDPGSSFAVSSKIAKEIYSYEHPSIVVYGMVGLQGQGSKMSGSKGNAVTPLQLLDIYQPSLLKWIYLRKSPRQTFSLAFNTEIYRQYDEFDRTIEKNNSDELDVVQEKQLEMSFDSTHDSDESKQFPFRQAVALGQMVQWDINKVKDILYSLDQQYDIKSIEQRLPYARKWLETYNPDDMIVLCDEVNLEYAKKMSSGAKAHIEILKQKLEGGMESIKELETTVYAIPKDESFSQKENGPLQREFFKNVYNLLIGKDRGPRLSTFLWAVDRKTVLRLLDI
jgi:lysyl-tRNA synthetase, class I